MGANIGLIYQVAMYNGRSTVVVCTPLLASTLLMIDLYNNYGT